MTNTESTGAVSLERGAAAVEFSLIAPLLILLVLGTIEFGQFFFVQANAANGAREGARAMAISQDASEARDVAEQASSFSTGETVSVGVSPCDAAKLVTVTVAISYDAWTGVFGKNFTATGTGVMRCGG